MTVHGLEDKERDGNKKWREKAGYLGEFVGKEVWEQTEGKIYLKRNLKYGRWVGRCGIVWELGKGGKLRPREGEDWMIRVRERDMSVGGVMEK